MRTASLVILTVAAATFAAALMLIPQDNERFAMAMRDKRLSEALAILQTQPAETMSADDLLERFRLAENAGDTADAEAALREYIRRNPSDLKALDALAKLYRGTQQADRYLETRLALYWRDPSRSRFHEAVGRYRLSGDVEAELELAETAVDGDWANDHDIARAGLLYAALERLDDAAECFSLLPSDRFEEFRQAHLTHIAVLLKLNRREEALEAATALSEASPGAFEPLKLLFEKADAGIARMFDRAGNSLGP